MTKVNALEFVDDKLKFIDQTLLPFEENYIVTDNYLRIAQAIERLEIRGAPAIGIAAAYAVAFANKNASSKNYDYLNVVLNRLRQTRPTAVNLFWALNEIENAYAQIEYENIYESLLQKALSIHNDDIKRCNCIAENGLQIFNGKSRILTHCNTGALATGGDGTALNVIKNAFENGLVEIVYVDETRPLLQGSRLTAFELEKARIPFKIITDSMAAFVIKNYDVDLVIVGADRIAANGDSANKIGSYGLSIISNFHELPFYVAAPESTIDVSIQNGSFIKIEFRDKKEILNIHDYNITKGEYDSLNPAFDIIPADLIAGIITENKLYKHPYHFK